MNIKEILSKVDHTLLSQNATWDEIKSICDDGIKYQTASVCIPASYVKQAKEYVQDNLAICTVIGFPNGYNTTATKVFETKDALANGADEIDMVINLGDLRGGRTDAVYEEICSVKKACNGRLLKVIIETCLLTDEEKILDVIAFPLNGNAQDVMLGAPSFVTKQQLEDVHLVGNGAVFGL